MKLLDILNETRLRARAPVPDDRTIIRTIAVACDNLLTNPGLPGDWWAQKIILETVRLLGEKP